MSNQKQKTRVVIYDFDGTLFNSPTREEAEKQYLQYAISITRIERGKGMGHVRGSDNVNKTFPFQGWWGRPESLNPPVVPKNPSSEQYIKYVVDNYHNDVLDKNTEVILMTGRPIKLKDRVLEICQNENLHFDRTFFTGQKGSKGSDTFEIKTNFIENEILEDQETLEIWEDRPEHVKKFSEKAKTWLSEKKTLKKVIINDVKQKETKIFTFLSDVQ